MNGRENSTAGALLFALISIGALIKGDELIGIGVGSICAIISAILLKQSIMQSASEQEENHQRIEIQFQQLRSRISDGGNSNQNQSMLAITHTMADSTEAIQESLRRMNDRLEFLENLSQLPQLIEMNDSTKAAMVTMSDSITANAKATQELLKKTSDNTEAQVKLIKVSVEKMSDLVEKITHIEDNSKKITELTESSQATVQTGLKLMQVIGQMLKSPPFAKDIAQLNTSMTTLAEKFAALDKMDKLDKLDLLENMSNNIETMSQNISEPLKELSNNNNAIAENMKSMSDSVEKVGEINKVISDEMLQINEQVTNVTTSVDKSTMNLVEMMNSIRDEISKLTMKIDAYNGLMKAALEQYSSLSEQDVKVLERIAEKVQ